MNTYTGDNAVVDAKLILDSVLYDDEYHNTLAYWKIDRSEVDSVWHKLDDFIYDNKISYGEQTDSSFAGDTADSEGAAFAIDKAYALLADIEESDHLWFESGDELSDILTELYAITQKLQY